jgi:hypothetical protein
MGVKPACLAVLASAGVLAGCGGQSPAAHVAKSSEVELAIQRAGKLRNIRRYRTLEESLRKAYGGNTLPKRPSN